MEVTKQFTLFLTEKARAARAAGVLDADIRAQLTPCRMRELIPIFLEGVYEHMSSNRALVQNAWRGCRSGDEAHSLADVFDPDFAHTKCGRWMAMRCAGPRAPVTWRC